MLFVLDLDDTLYLERDYVRSGFMAADQWIKNNYNNEGFYEIAWQLFENGTRGTIFNQALSKLGLKSTSLVETLVGVYREHPPLISLESDAAAFLDTKSKQDLAIITDGYAVTQWKKIHALHLDRIVGNVIVTDDWGKEFWKPHPRAFEQVSSGHPPKECIYIADNPNKDFISPDKLGWAPSIRINRPNSLHALVKSPDSCIEISSFTKIMDMDFRSANHIL